LGARISVGEMRNLLVLYEIDTTKRDCNYENDVVRYVYNEYGW
jgi:hypothetical protein